jgi:TAG lipase/lysophosphatidylethanolamine acyltransferase
MDEVVSQLEHVAEAGHTTLSRQAKIDFFMETRQSFGSSALLLHGGASFGMYHLGVVKTLFENGLLPRIISGASVGALVAAMVCVKTDEELPSIFEEGGIDLSAFQRVGVRGSLSRKFTRLMTEGYLIDIKVLQNCIQTNVGNLTFDEAFKRTKRVLNITVPSSRKSEGPQLLNYITSPNVLISSAACTSISMLGFSSVADLLAKDNSGNIIRWTPSASNYTNPITPSFFSYGVVSPETPLTRLSELFNVNHFIVSQANPYIVPFMSRGLKNRKTGFDRFSAGLMERIARVILAELTHRMGQVCLLNSNIASSSFGAPLSALATTY